MYRIEAVTPWQELESGLRETKLLETRDEQTIFPYENANIVIDEIGYDEVKPTSLYVLRKNLAIQSAITCDIKNEGFNQLDLEHGLVLADKEGKLTGLTPPIVEETEVDGLYILDGAHRTSIGRWLGRTSFLAVRISGIREDCPSYAQPNEWDEVKIWEAVPADLSQKKHYREGFKSLYRNYGQLTGGQLRSK